MGIVHLKCRILSPFHERLASLLDTLTQTLDIAFALVPTIAQQKEFVYVVGV